MLSPKGVCEVRVRSKGMTGRNPWVDNRPLLYNSDHSQ